VTDAAIVFGPDTQTKFPVHIARDGEAFKIGALTVEVLHTPGHTLESSCYLLKDENGKDHCIFTGDTLFVGDVGRPDLAQKADELTMNDLAGMMYESLQQKIKEDFVKDVADGLETPPEYFPINARINKEGYDSIDELVTKGTKQLSINEFRKFTEQGAIILDTRSAN